MNPGACSDRQIFPPARHGMVEIVPTKLWRTSCSTVWKPIVMPPVERA
jgi:hypothetical protein